MVKSKFKIKRFFYPKIFKISKLEVHWFSIFFKIELEANFLNSIYCISEESWESFHFSPQTSISCESLFAFLCHFSTPWPFPWPNFKRSFMFLFLMSYPFVLHPMSWSHTQVEVMTLVHLCMYYIVIINDIL